MTIDLTIDLPLTRDEIQALQNLVRTSSVSGTDGMRLLIGLEDKLSAALARLTREVPTQNAPPCPSPA